MFEQARASTRDARQRLESLLRNPLSPSSDSKVPVGKVVDDMLIQTSEEQLIAALDKSMGSPEELKFLAECVMELLRNGELKFAKSTTHATKLK